MLGSTYTKHGLYLIALISCFIPVIGAFGADDDQPLEVIVKRGDSLSSIVIRETGNTDPGLWKRVAEFNNQSVDKTLEIGNVILLPADLFEPNLVVFKDLTETPTISSGEPLAESETTEITPALVNDDECEGQQVCFEVKVSGEISREVSVVEQNDTEGEVTQNSDLSTDERSTAQQTDVDESSIADETAADSSSQPLAQSTVTNEQATAEVQVDQVTSKPVEKAQPQPQAKPEPTPAPKPAQSGSAATSQADSAPPRPKPGLFEVDEDSAVRALERSLIQLNALLLRPRRAEVTLNYDYSINENANPVLVSVEDLATNTTVQQVGQVKSEVQNNTVALDLKLGLPYDSQISLRLPMSFIDRQVGVVVPGAAPDDQDSSSNGVGDFAISLDKTLAVERGRRPDIILSASYNSDSGSDEISSDANEFTVGIRATKRQDPLVFTASLSQTIAQESDAGVTAGNITQFSIGTLLAASPYTSLQFLFNQALVSGSEFEGQPIPNTDGNIASFATGVSSVLGRDLFFNAQLAIGLVDRANDYRLSFSLAKQFSY